MTVTSQMNNDLAAQPHRDWWGHAACRKEGSDMFYPDGKSEQYRPQIEKAKAMCDACPVRQQCLAWALATGESHGIYGGMTDDERRALLRRERRRMPGHGNPELAWVQILRDRRPEFIALQAAGSSVREIAEVLGTNGQTVHNVLRALEAEKDTATEAVAA